MFPRQRDVQFFGKLIGIEVLDLMVHLECAELTSKINERTYLARSQHPSCDIHLDGKVAAGSAGARYRYDGIGAFIRNVVG